jgi:hypothetical protein
MLSIRDIIQTRVKKLTSEIHYLKDYITGYLLRTGILHRDIRVMMSFKLLQINQIKCSPIPPEKSPLFFAFCRAAVL